MGMNPKHTSTKASIWIKNVNLVPIEYDNFPLQEEKKFIFTEKVNGILSVLLYYKIRNKPQFVTKIGTIYENLFVLDEYNRILQQEPYIKSIIIAGESVAYDNGKILPFNITQSVIKTSYKSIKNNSLHHHFPFDIININGKDLMSEKYEKRIEMLHSLFRNAKMIHPVKYVKGDLSKAWNTLVNRQGIEGLVARNSVNYKIKTSHTFDLVIVAVGFVDKKALDKKLVSYTKVALMNNKKQFILISKVGSGLSIKLRKYLYDFAMKNKTKPNQFSSDFEIWVKPKIIIEVKFMDYYIKQRPSFIYDKNNNEYRFISTDLACTLVHPSFIRIRDDKEVNVFDINIKQIPGF